MLYIIYYILYVYIIDHVFYFLHDISYYIYIHIYIYYPMYPYDIPLFRHCRCRWSCSLWIMMTRAPWVWS